MNLIDTYLAVDRATLEAFIQNRQSEHLLLDFKVVKHATLNSDDDKRNLVRALSGFANSSGGLIVWGVDARPNKDGVDCAVDFKPIADLPLFVSRLNQLTSEAASPVIDGIQHRAIAFDGAAGCAISLV